MYNYADEGTGVAVDLDQFLMIQDQFEEDADESEMIIIQDDFFDEK